MDDASGPYEEHRQANDVGRRERANVLGLLIAIVLTWSLAAANRLWGSTDAALALDDYALEWLTLGGVICGAYFVVEDHLPEWFCSATRRCRTSPSGA
jgi:sterol desaturase/sphingolipid hydroxylase (fatty acid hydroxylase superfamily)